MLIHLLTFSFRSEIIPKILFYNLIYSFQRRRRKEREGERETDRQTDTDLFHLLKHSLGDSISALLHDHPPPPHQDSALTTWATQHNTETLFQMKKLRIILKIKKIITIHLPGWCSSVNWARACEPKCCWFNSQSGYKPGLRARSLVGGGQ